VRTIARDRFQITIRHDLDACLAHHLGEDLLVNVRLGVPLYLASIFRADAREELRASPPMVSALPMSLEDKPPATIPPIHFVGSMTTTLAFSRAAAIAAISPAGDAP